MQNSFDVIVVGAGASGLAAGVEAARAGSAVLVLEKNHVPARKVLSTGAGKCNFSNASINPAHYHPPAGAFLNKTFAALSPSAVTEFFGGLGLLWVKDEKGRLFPRSMKAQDVAASLCNELAFRGGRIQTLTEVSAISPGSAGFSVEAFKVPPQWEKKAAKGEKNVFRAGRVILAAGSPCYPQIGGSASGCSLLRDLGHCVAPMFPVLVPLKSEEPFLGELDGVRAEASLKLRLDEEVIAERCGEILFTAYGLSGPAALDLSRAAITALKDYRVLVEADFFPELSPAKLGAMLKKRAAAFAGRPFRHFACGLLNEKLLKVCAGRCGLGWDAPVGPGMEGLGALLKAFPAVLSGTLGFEDAMVAAGGCSLDEVMPDTFASKKIPGLYVAGELLDLDGDSGGYNLHLAWTSGILAGRDAARK